MCIALDGLLLNILLLKIFLTVMNFRISLIEDRHQHRIFHSSSCKKLFLNMGPKEKG